MGINTGSAGGLKGKRVAYTTVSSGKAKHARIGMSRCYRFKGEVEAKADSRITAPRRQG
jgi:hypothetical protein